MMWGTNANPAMRYNRVMSRLVVVTVLGLLLVPAAAFAAPRLGVADRGRAEQPRKTAA